MKITATAKALTAGLSFVGRAAAKQGGNAPHLTSVLFEASRETGLTTMCATDAEIAASLTSTAPKIKKSGKAALPVRTLSDLIGRIDPEKEVALEATENEVTLTVGDAGNHYSLRAAKAGEFPPLPEFPLGAEESFSLKARTLREAIRRVSPAASTDDSRPVLGGLLFSFESEGQADEANGTNKADGAAAGGATNQDEVAPAGEASKHSTALNVVATDSYRMTVAEDRSERIAHSPCKAVVPARALKEAVRLCSLGPERVEVALTRDSAFFRVGGVMLSTRLIAGSFPEYRRLLPEDEAFEHTYAVDAADLLDVLKRANLFAARQSPPAPVRLTFDASRGVLSVSVESEAVGSALESLPAKVLDPVWTDGGKDRGENFEILFNPTFLTDAVKSCSGAGEGASGDAAGVVFRMNAAHKPAVLEPRLEENGDADETFGATLKCLIMPMADPRPKEASS